MLPFDNKLIIRICNGNILRRNGLSEDRKNFLQSEYIQFKSLADESSTRKMSHMKEECHKDALNAAYHGKVKKERSYLHKKCVYWSLCLGILQISTNIISK